MTQTIIIYGTEFTFYSLKICLNSLVIFRNKNPAASFRGFCLAIYSVTLLLLLLLLLFYYYYYYYYFSCHRLILPGSSLEPTVIPTAHASSFTLQYFPYYV
jgi:hypothetical protein